MLYLFIQALPPPCSLHMCPHFTQTQYTALWLLEADKHHKTLCEDGNFRFGLTQYNVWGEDTKSRQEPQYGDLEEECDVDVWVWPQRGGTS